MAENNSGEEQWEEEEVEQEEEDVSAMQLEQREKEAEIAAAFDRRRGKPSQYVQQVCAEGAQTSAPFVGGNVAPSEEVTIDTSAPDMNLELEYVYGYRCFDTRQNVYFNKSTNEIVYCAAALGIVMDTAGTAQRFFGGKEIRNLQGHTDDITALAVHPNQTLVATGEVGRNPAVIVWDSTNCTEVSQFKNGDNSRAVTCLAFSGDGELLVTCALDNFHTVRVFDWAKGKQLFENRGGSDKIMDVAFSPISRVFVTAGVKHINFWTEASGEFTKQGGVFGKNGKPTDLTTAQYLPDGKAVTGGANGFLYLWEGRTCVVSKNPHSAEKCSVHTLRVADEFIISGSADKSLVLLNFTLEEVRRYTLDSFPRAVDYFDGKIIAGCRDGSLNFIDGDNVTQIMSSHYEGEVWGLDTCAANPETFVTTADDNQIKVWNLVEHKCISTSILDSDLENKGKVRKAGAGASTMTNKTKTCQQSRALALNATTGHVAIGFNNGKVLIKADINSLGEDQTIAKFRAGKEWIEAMKYSPDGQFLAVGSHDNALYIYQVSETEYTLKGENKFAHSSFITDLDWSLDGRAIHTCCGAHEQIFWTVGENGELEHNPDGASQYRDEVWNTYSNHYGWSVQGIFGQLRDFTHVNRVCRSLDKSTFAVANDYGLVELFRNPNDKTCRSKGYKAHSEHVTNVKFTSDSRYILSAGGYDQCIMQWRIV